MKLYISAATLRTIEKYGRCDLTSISSIRQLATDIEIPLSAVPPAECAPREAVAWLVTGGRVFVDRTFTSKQHAEKSAAERNDGATVVPLVCEQAAKERENG